ASDSAVVSPPALAAAGARVFSGGAVRSSIVRFGSDTGLLWPASGRDLVPGVQVTHAAARGRAFLVSARPAGGATSCVPRNRRQPGRGWRAPDPGRTRGPLAKTTGCGHSPTSRRDAPSTGSGGVANG